MKVTPSRLLAESPFLYCLAARSRRGRNRRVAKRGIDLVVEAYPRSGNTFLVALLARANPTRTVASHVHHPCHVARALTLGIPCAVVVRSPDDAVLSDLVYRSASDAASAFGRWHDFYSSSAVQDQRCLLIDFDRLTKDPQSTYERLCRHADIDVRPLPAISVVLDDAKELGDRRFGSIDERRVSRPSAARDALKRDRHGALLEPVAATSRARAHATYQRMAERCQ